MIALKRILNYIFWSVMALLCSFGYLYYLLGDFPDGSAWYDPILLIFYRLVYLYFGLSLAGLIAIIYMLLDVFYLRKKLQTNLKSFIIRCLAIIGITILLACIHLFLEKGIDVI